MRLLSVWLPLPRLSLAVGIVWLLLHGSLAPGHVAMALAVAWAVPGIVRHMVPDLPRVKRPAAALGYVMLVLWDILVANVRVARLVVGPLGHLRPRVVVVPLDTGEPAVVAILAATVTLTPGTVTLHADAAERRLEVHALDVTDPDALVAEIKHRYERRLREVFGC